MLEYTVRDESAIFAFDDVWVAVPIEGQRVPVENINDVMNEPYTVDTDSEFEDPRSESLSVGKSFMSMEEFGRYILEEEVPVLNTAGISREEQFGYILEEFLKQHDYLPPELTDKLFEMLEDIKESIAKQKNNSKEEKHEIDLTGEGGDNEKSLVVSDRSDDGDNSGEETEVPADDTDEKAGLVESERPANADIYLEDLWMSDDGDVCLEEIEGPADDESVVGSDETDEEAEDCVAIDHPGFRFPKIKDIDVVMVNTGEKIYNDIAGFFGCKCFYLSLVTRKHVYGVFDQVRLKPACSATCKEASLLS